VARFVDEIRMGDERVDVIGRYYSRQATKPIRRRIFSIVQASIKGSLLTPPP